MTFKRDVIVLAIGCALVLAPAIFGQEDVIGWRTDLEVAKRQAAAENKLVLVHFWGSFCRPCLNLEKFVFTNPRIGSAINESYIPIKIDVEEQPGLAQEFGITTIPHDVVITPHGKIVAKQASPSNSDGYLHMIQSSAQKAARSNPRALAAAAQIATAVPANTPPIINAYTPAEQSSIIPEPIRMIGDSAPIGNQEVRTVAGQMIVPIANDERKLNSPQRPQEFLQDLKLAPAQATNYPLARTTTPSPAVPQNRGGLSLQTLRPLNESPNPRPVTTRLSQSAPAAGNETPTEPLAVASEAIQPDIALAPLPDQAPVLATIPVTAPMRPTEPAGGRPLPLPIEQVSIAPNAQHPLGFAGFCPATWFATGQFVPGDPKWGCEHRGRLYFFASSQLRGQFRLTPDLLSPMLAGYDSVSFVRTGALHDGSLDHSVILDSDQLKAIYLFSTAENKAIFLDHSQKYIDEVRQAMRAADQAAVYR